MGVIDKIKNSVQKAKKSIRATTNRLLKGVSSVVNKAKIVVNNAVSPIKTVVSNAVNTLGNKILDNKKKVVQVVDSVVSKAKEVVSSSVSKAKNLIRNEYKSSKGSFAGGGYSGNFKENIKTITIKPFESPNVQSKPIKFNEVAIKPKVYNPSTKVYNPSKNYSQANINEKPLIYNNLPYENALGGYTVGEGKNEGDGLGLTVGGQARQGISAALIAVLALGAFTLIG